MNGLLFLILSICSVIFIGICKKSYETGLFAVQSLVFSLEAFLGFVLYAADIDTDSKIINSDYTQITQNNHEVQIFTPAGGGSHPADFRICPQFR